MDIESGHAYRLTVDDSVNALIISPSGHRLIVAHATSVCIIDSTSGAKLFEAPVLDSTLAIVAMSWPEECNEDD